MESADIGDEEVLCLRCDVEEGRAFLTGLTFVVGLAGIEGLALWLVM